MVGRQPIIKVWIVLLWQHLRVLFSKKKCFAYHTSAAGQVLTGNVDKTIFCAHEHK